MAQAQAQRYFIEHSFQETKHQAGMSEYQIRGLLAWHHHMALVMMSKFFILSEKIRFKNQYPLMSTYDARQIIIEIYAKKVNGIDDVIFQMKHRHISKQKSINQYFKT